MFFSSCRGGFRRPGRASAVGLEAAADSAEGEAPDQTRDRAGAIDSMCYHTYLPYMSTDLRADIKQSAPFRSGEEEAFLNLLRTSALLEHAAASFLKEHGLTLTQYNALRILRGAGPKGLCRNEVSQRMVKPVTDATRLLDRMAAAGWVKRDREDGDRRFVTARITRAGLDLLGMLDDEVTGFHERQLGHMSKRDLSELTRLLGSARSG